MKGHRHGQNGSNTLLGLNFTIKITGTIASPSDSVGNGFTWDWCPKESGVRGMGKYSNLNGSARRYQGLPQHLSTKNSLCFKICLNSLEHVSIRWGNLQERLKCDGAISWHRYSRFVIELKIVRTEPSRHLQKMERNTWL
jgi:hypothetical protein